MNKGIKCEKGVTLTTLVITIIILLILAGVSIAVLSGPNGLIEKAKLAAKNTEIAEVKEKVELKLTNLNMETLEQTKEMATLTDVMKLKDKDAEIKDAYNETDNVVLIVGDYECKISKQLQVESVSEYNPRQLRKVKRDLTFCDIEKEDVQ